MGHYIEAILRKSDRLAIEIEELESRLRIQRYYTIQLEDKCTTAEEKVAELYKLLDETSDEAFRDKRMLEKLQEQHANMTDELESKTEEAKKFQAQAEASHKAMAHQEQQMAAIRTSLDRLTTSNNMLQVKLTKTQGDFESMVQLKDKITIALNVKTNTLKLKEDENKRFRLENAMLTKSKDLLQRQIMAVEMAKSAMELEVSKFK